MKTLNIKTTGGAPNEVIEFSAKDLADAIQAEFNGRPASDVQAGQLTQDFVDKFGIIARYHSGTFLGFKFPEEAEDEFETFKVR